jgi:tetratricopeptide (TPR) repeat protein
MDDKASDCVNSARALWKLAWRSPMSYQPLREARAILETFVEADQGDVVALTCLGAVLCDLHLYAQAREYLERAVQLGSTDRNTFFNLYVAMLDNEAMEVARALLDKGAHLERNPETWEAYFDPQAM